MRDMCGRRPDRTPILAPTERPAGAGHTCRLCFRLYSEGLDQQAERIPRGHLVHLDQKDIPPRWLAVSLEAAIGLGRQGQLRRASVTLSGGFGETAGQNRSFLRPLMHASKREAKMRHYQHWETWLGLLVCGLCAGLGSYFGGEYVQHPSISTGIGGSIGALLFRAATKYVDRRYYSRTF